MAFNSYFISRDQDIFDLCIILYGSLDYLSKLMQDNNMTINDWIPGGTVILYDSKFIPNPNRITTGWPNAYISPSLLPQILSQTGNVQVCGLSTSVTLSVVAINGPLTYLWQYSVDGGSTWTDTPGVIGSYISGSTTSSLLIITSPVVNLNYRCEIINSLGTIYSEAMEVEVLATVVSVSATRPIQFIGYPGSFYLTSPVVTGPGFYNIFWEYSTDGGVTWNIATSGPILGYSGSSFIGVNSTTLTITKIQIGMNGWGIRTGISGCNTVYSHPLFINALAFQPETITFGNNAQSLGETLDPLTQLLPLDNLVKELKGINVSPSVNILPKFNAIYPMLGSTPAVHALNLIQNSSYSPTSAQNFYIQWYGTPIHSSNGVQFNNGSYGDTRLEPYSVLTINKKHLSFYSGTNSFNYTLPALLGAMDGSPVSIDGMELELTSPGNAIGGNLSGSVSSGNVTGVLSNTLGFYLINRSGPQVSLLNPTGALSSFTYTVNTYTNVTVANPIDNILLGSYNGSYSDKQCRFASIGFDVSSYVSEIATWVTTFNQALGRI